MALYDELPVFKAAYDLLLDIYRFSSTLTREYKYTLGEKLKNETLELLMLVYRANSSKTKFDEEEATVHRMCRDKSGDAYEF